MARGRKGTDYTALLKKCQGCEGLGYLTKLVPENAEVRAHGLESIKLNCSQCRGTGERPK